MTTTQPKRHPIPFGKYLLLDRINIGGMAEVWRGKQFGASGFERLVAIKRILPNIAEDEEFIQMFIDEAKISVQLNHANIGQIFELGQIANSYFIAMEYIPGKDMRAIFDRCRKKGEPAPVPLVAYCVSKMCEGLDFAHRKKDGMGRDLNVVHRDISPQNILISYEGEVKVIDFGIAKAAGKATKTQAGILKGKFGYMSPEQIRGLPLDRRSDIFAIGVCLYEMLTGERLFVGDSDFSVLEKVRKAEVPPPSTYNRRIPEALEKIVLKALARDVDERYQYASELGDDLQRFLLTNDAIFGRKDLMQYMKSTFAEEVEREKQRLVEYAAIKPPEAMLAAIEAGFNGGQMAGAVTAPAPAPSALAPSPPPAPPEPPRSVAAPVAAPSPPGPGPRRTQSITVLPKLTAATAAPPPNDDEGAATMLVDPSEYFDNNEPTTQPGTAGGRAITPTESPLTFSGELPTGKTAVIGPPQSLSSQSLPTVQPRPSVMSLPVVTPAITSSPPMPRAPSVTLPPVGASMEPGTAPVLRSMGRSAGEGLPRIIRQDPPAAPPVLSPAQAPSRPILAPVAASPPRSAMGPDTEPQIPVPPTGSNRIALFALLGVVALAVLGGLGYFLMQSPATGFIMVQVPQEARAQAQVTLNAKPVELKEGGSVVEPVPAGEVLVVVSAEGFEPFMKTVVVPEGTQVTPVQAVLKRMDQMVSLVLVTEPPDAEVKVDGKGVRAQGDVRNYFENIPSNGELQVEVLAPGFRPFLKKYPAPEGTKEVKVSAKLEPEDFAVRVESEPAGATISAGGKELGRVTPADIRLPANIKKVTLRLRCYQDAELTVPSPASGQSQAVVKGSLKRQPKQSGCR